MVNKTLTDNTMDTLPSNIPELLDALGDPRTINSTIAGLGYRPPSTGSIRIWRHRQFIASRWHIPVIRAAAQLAPNLPADHIGDLLSKAEMA